MLEQDSLFDYIYIYMRSTTREVKVDFCRCTVNQVLLRD